MISSPTERDDLTQTIFPNSENRTCRNFGEGIYELEMDGVRLAS